MSKGRSKSAKGGMSRSQLLRQLANKMADNMPQQGTPMPMMPLPASQDHQGTQLPTEAQPLPGID